MLSERMEGASWSLGAAWLSPRVSEVRSEKRGTPQQQCATQGGRRDLGAVIIIRQKAGESAGTGSAMPRSVGGLCGGLGWLLGVSRGQRRGLSWRIMWPHLNLGAPDCPLPVHWRAWRPGQGLWGWGEWTDWEAIEVVESPPGAGLGVGGEGIGSQGEDCRVSE